MPDLRPYQQAAVAEVEAHWQQGVKRVVLVLPTGAGKTISATAPVATMLSQGGRVLWLAHRRELISQAAKSLVSNGIRDVGMISPQHHADPWAKVQVASSDTLVARGVRPQADLVVFDECFPGTTSVLMLDGSTLPIRNVRVGLSVAYGGRVRHVFRRPVTALLRIVHESGILICTHNHPVYTESHGYIQAAHLVHGHVLRVRKKLHMGWADERGPSAHLFPTVPLGCRVGDHGLHQSGLRECSDEDPESYGNSGSAREDASLPYKGGPQASGAGRQRARSDAARICFGDGVPGTGHALRGVHGTPLSVAIKLQAGLGTRGDEDSDRSGRRLPWVAGTAVPGPEENVVPGRSRVVRTEVLEPGSNGTFGGLCPDRTVYNLETDRGAYVAADVLVHNCHHARAKTYQELLSSYPEARVLGLTATPARSDEKPLGDIFEQLVVGATYSQMLALHQEHPDQGIVPCRVFQSPEYLGSDLAQEPVDAWRGLVGKGLDGPCVVFCRSVDDAKARVQQFRMAGVKADLVTGQCGDAHRAKALDDFRAGKIRVLVNVQVLTEGTDIPSIQVCMIASGCSSALAYLQKVGRALRPAPGKDFAVLVDLVGVSLPGVYGSPTADRHYSLDGNPITVEGASLKHCPKCGMSVAMALKVCDGFMPKTGEPCRYVFEGKPRKAVKVWNLALQEAIDAAGGDVRAVSREAKLDEAQVLLKIARTNGYDVLWAVQRWKKTFQVAAFPLQLLSQEERRAVYAKFVAQGKAAGWKPIAARVKYKAMLGAWPEG